MWARNVPSSTAPILASAARERALRASVLNSTRLQRSTSKQCVSWSSFASVFAGPRWNAGVSQVAPISSRLCVGSIARYEVEPITRPLARSSVAKGRAVPRARPSSEFAANARMAGSSSSRNGK